MSRRFERVAANAETLAITAVLVVLAIAYVVFRLTGG
jgi:hypothetical protein